MFSTVDTIRISCFRVEGFRPRAVFIGGVLPSFFFFAKPANTLNEGDEWGVSIGRGAGGVGWGRRNEARKQKGQRGDGGERRAIFVMLKKKKQFFSPSPPPLPRPSLLSFFLVRNLYPSRAVYLMKKTKHTHTHTHKR